MIHFFADDHFGMKPGRQILELLRAEFPFASDPAAFAFHENDWSALESPQFPANCSLLILNLIGDTGNIPHASAQAEPHVRAYIERGGEVLLLHGSSAAFWQWDWWRTLCGLRWVRSGDPDGVPASTHPVRPFRVEVSKTRHALASRLQDMDLPEDEIYINLEQTSPVTVLMHTHIEEGTYPQCFEAHTPFGGRVLTLLPGHRATTFAVPQFRHNLAAAVRYLLSRATAAHAT